MMKLNQTFTMLALICVSHSLFAMQPLNDQVLAQTTGQDGLTVTLTTAGTSARLLWHDNDGWAGRGPDSSAGSLILGNDTAAGNFRINAGTTVITVDADAGASGTSPMLNIGIKLPDQLEFSTGEVFIAKHESNGTVSNTVKIMNDMTVQMHGLNLNMQLGNEAQGNMLLATGVIASGLRINNFGLLDGSASDSTHSYGIGIGQILIKDSGQVNNDLTLKGIGVDVNSNGLFIGVLQSDDMDIQLRDVRMGNLADNTTSLGNAELRGINLMGSSMTISGH